MPRTVILGAAGFVGSHLVDALLARGHQLVAVDNFITGMPRNLAHLAGDPRVEQVTQDICEPFDVEGEVDFVLNFASPASPIKYLQVPIETLKVGALGTLHGLELAERKGARFLQASTSEVYGDPLEHPQRETYLGNVDTIGPRGVYDEGKRFGEAAVMAFHRARGLDTRIVRIFNAYGPRMSLDDGRVVPAFISQSLGGEPLTLFGDGQQTRSFCYIDDLVEGILALLFSDETSPVNVGNPGEFTIRELAELIQKVAGVELPVRYLPLPEGDPKVRQPDISKAQALLGWSPKTSLEEGLTRTIQWFRERPRA